jgi:hypothetical protein
MLNTPFHILSSFAWAMLQGKSSIALATVLNAFMHPPCPKTT